MILVADGEAAFKVMVELDAFAGVGAAIGARGNGQGVTGEGDGVVIGDGALVVEAEDILGEEGWGPRQVSGIRLGRGAGKAAVESGQEATQDKVGLVEVGGPSLTKGLDEAVLKGAEEALNAALGLRGKGADEADMESIDQAAELAAWRLSSEFLGQGRTFRALEDGVLVGVKAQGDAKG